MILRKLFKKQKKDKDSAIRQILEGEALELDNPFVVYVATEIVSEFGDVLEKTSKFIWGVSENRLPHSKQLVETAIEVLLMFFQNEESWGRFKKAFPDVPADAEVLTMIESLSVPILKNALVLKFFELKDFYKSQIQEYQKENNKNVSRGKESIIN